MGKVITHRFVESVRPKAARTEYPDAGCPGLYLVVQPSGTKSWAFRGLHDGKSIKKTLGRAGDGGLSLAAARAAAAAYRHRLEQGRAPHLGVTPVTAVTGKTGRGDDKIETAAASFLELHAYRKTRPSTAWATERVFNRIILPAWRGRTIASICKRDVIDLVESVAVSGRGYLANRTLGTLSKFFNWLVARDVLAFSPVTGIEKPHKEEAREHTLSDAELRRLWLACEGDGPFGQALRVLISTGARRNEVSQMRRSELDQDGTWTLPRERSKNRRPHKVVLPSQARAIIAAMPLIADCDFVFTADGKRPLTGWDKAKVRISAKAGIAADTWRLHDLRRSAASGMQRLGISVPVIERALNHISGVFRGIVGVYQQHDYADEVRIALQKWADHVQAIVDGKPATVVSLRQHTSARVGA
jgi:integrase